MKRLIVLIALALFAGCSRKAETPIQPAVNTAEAARSANSGAPARPAATPTTAVPRASTGALDACGLISPEELSRITGNTFKAGVNSTTLPEVMRCTFPRGGGGGISIILHLNDATAEYRSMAGMVAVPGIPDEAWWSPQVTTFVDRKGSQVLVVGFNFSGGDQKKWGEAIIRAILPKL
jgi:hypothetical protein